MEFARLGAATLGIEIREAHLAKARFAADANDLPACLFVQDDVRNLSKAKYGQFDVVLCAGILYHLPFPDNIRLVENMASVSRGLVIVDTHVALSRHETPVVALGDLREFGDGGQVYHGRRAIEHAANVTAAEKRDAHPWASIDNDESVWLTEESLVRSMQAAGLEVVYRGFPSREFERCNPDRLTLVARSTSRST